MERPQLYDDFTRRVGESKPSKADINFVVMDYLITEGYPAAAQKFALEAGVTPTPTIESIEQRVVIRDAIHAGKIESAIEQINELNSELLEADPKLHFALLQLQLIELIRSSINVAGGPTTAAFTPALEFATSQLAPRAPTSAAYLHELERTMALLIFPSEKLTPQLKALLDLEMRRSVAKAVNEAIIAFDGHRREARLRDLVRLRCWSERQAHDSKLDIPALGQSAWEGVASDVPRTRDNVDAMIS